MTGRPGEGCREETLKGLEGEQREEKWYSYILIKIETLLNKGTLY